MSYCHSGAMAASVPLGAAMPVAVPDSLGSGRGGVGGGAAGVGSAGCAGAVMASISLKNQRSQGT